jgi:hypothetical protein
MDVPLAIESPVDTVSSVTMDLDDPFDVSWDLVGMAAISAKPRLLPKTTDLADSPASFPKGVKVPVLAVICDGDLGNVLGCPTKSASFKSVAEVCSNGGGMVALSSSSYSISLISTTDVRCRSFVTTTFWLYPFHIRTSNSCVVSLEMKLARKYYYDMH